MALAPADLRVAVISGNYNYCADGVALVLNRLVAHLLEQGVRVKVFAPTKKKPVLQHAGELISVPSLSFLLNPNYRLAWGLPSRIRQQIAEFRPHVIHCATPDLLGFAALRLARRLKVPAVATYHTHFATYLHYFGLGLMEPLCWRVMRRFYNQTRETFVPSASMREVLQKHGVSCPLTVWEHGVDAERFSPQRRSLEWRRAQGIRDEEILVGFVGRVGWEKNVALWGDVVQRLDQCGRPIRSIMIGDGPARPAMQTRLKNTLFPGYMGHDALPAAFASFDVFLNPSTTETFGCVTLEAMACGVPPVVADATGSRDIVTHEVNGFICRPGDPGDFAQRVMQLADNPSLRQRLCDASTQHAAGCTWDHVMQQMVEHYLRIADAPVPV
jgi:glycosyltransferase involved in cell wall biosynthesis